MRASRTRCVALLASVLTGTSLADLVSGEDAAPAQDPHAASVDLFTRQCAACHTPPDPAFAVDRIWLDQVRRTA